MSFEDELFSSNEYGIEDDLRWALGRNELKFEVLKNNLPRKNYDSVHINLNGIFTYIEKSILSKVEKNEDDFSTIISSGIINIVAHYRHFFSGRSVTPKIYLYAKTEWQSSSIMKSIEDCTVILQFIPGAYMISYENHVDASIYMKYFIDKNNGTALALTKEICDLQLIDDGTDLIYSNKDKSKFYSEKNLYRAYTEKDEDFRLSSKLIGPVVFFAGAGLKNSGVKGFGKSKTVKLFEELVSKGTLGNSLYRNADDFVNDFSKYKEIDLDNFIHNFKKHDLAYNYSKHINASVSITLDNLIIDKFAKKSLQKLNTEFFTGVDSLMLDYLMEFRE